MRHNLHRRSRKYHRNQFKEHLADIKYHRDKPVANHFNQVGHSIHKFRVKEMWPLFTDNARDMKGMESYLTEKLGSEQPGGINEKQPFKYYSSYISTIELKCSIHFMFFCLNPWFILSYFLLIYTLTSHYVFRYN